MDKKTIYIIIAVVAVVAIVGGIIIAMSTNNNNGPKQIEYNGNGGSSMIGDVVYYTESTVQDCNFTRTNYHLIGYTASADGSGTVYKIGDKAPDVSKLYAQWELNSKTTVKLTNIPDTIKVTYNGQEIQSGTVLEDKEKCRFELKVESKGPEYEFDQVTETRVDINEGGHAKYYFDIYRTNYYPADTFIQLDETNVYYMLITIEQAEVFELNFHEN